MNIHADGPSRVGLRYEVLPASLAAGDHRAVCELLVMAFGDCDARLAACGEAPVDRRFVARENGEIVGHQAVKRVQLMAGARYALALGDLVVDSGYRRRGIARRLILAAVADARVAADLVVTRTILMANVFAELGFERAEHRLRAPYDGDMSPIRDAWLLERRPSDKTYDLDSAEF